jgi:hypothetical protein
MQDSTLFKPRNAPIRKPTSNAKDNGRIVNPPRFSQIGGLKSGSLFEDHFSLKKPGDTK